MQAKVCTIGMTLALYVFLSGCSTSHSGTSTTTMTSQAALSSSTLIFTSQTVGATSASQSVTLTNSGTAALSISSIAASGDFAETNTCGSSVAASGSCTIAVTFTPTVVGTRTGSLTVTDNASGSPQTVGLTASAVAVQVNGGCAETGTANFPGCLSLSSPTSLTTSSTASTVFRRAGALARPMAVTTTGNFQTAFAAQTAQIAALLDGSDPTPVKTLETLGSAAINTNINNNVNAASNFCFGPRIWFTNSPDAGTGMVTTNGQINAGDLGIWSPTDSSGTQSCAAAELNYLLSGDADHTQFALAIAAEVQYLAGSSFPTKANTSFDATSAMTQLFSAASNGSSPVTFNAVTVSYDGTSYAYATSFVVLNASGNINGTVMLTHTPGASSTVYSGVAEYEFDNGTNVTAGTIRYQRTSATHIDISARDSFYPTGTTPALDANGELDPTDPNFILRFARIGASFDPTSPLAAGSYLMAVQLNAPGASGMPPYPDLLDTFQLILPGDGTGSAYYGFGEALISSPNVWQATGTLAAGTAVGTIDHIYCNRETGVAQLYAQYQPLEYSSTTGQYEPSTTIPAQIRFAPTSTCTYTDAQWNNGAAGGFWYDRLLQDANSMTQPTAPATIPQNVVADPADTNFPFSLFGDNTTWPQTLINKAGFTFPALY